MSATRYRPGRPAWKL